MKFYLLAAIVFAVAWVWFHFTGDVGIPLILFLCLGFAGAALEMGESR